MKVIIPAAGIGRRLRPHTTTTPKALLPVAGKPIIGHIIDRLIDLPELDEFIFITGFLGDKIKKYINTNYQINARFVKQEELRGLGYAVFLALQDLADDPLLVVLGDTILETDFSFFIQPGKDVLGVCEVDDPRRFGVVELTDGRISRLVEKPSEPTSRLAVVGIYGFSNTALLKTCLSEVVQRDQTTAGEIQITDALQLMVERGSVMMPHEVSGWYDCGNLETLLQTNRFLLAGLHQAPPIEDAVVIPPSFIAPTAQVSRSIIGPHVSVGDRAVVCDSVLRDTIIGEGAEVRRCLLEHSMIGNAASVKGAFKQFNVGDFSSIGDW